jgi:hypothetical protein
VIVSNVEYNVGDALGAIRALNWYELVSVALLTFIRRKYRGAGD